MAYTEGVQNVKDAAGTSTPVDVALVTNTSTTEAVTGSTAARQIMSIGSPSTPGQVAEVDANNALQVKGSKTTVIDTTTNLTSGQTFTSAWFDTQADGTIFVQVKLFVSTIGGTLNIDLSPDSSNANLTTTLGAGISIGVSANPQTVPFVVPDRYFRLRYVNGAGTQTNFELTHTSYTYMPFSAVPLGASINSVTTNLLSSSPALVVQGSTSGVSLPTTITSITNSITKGTQAGSLGIQVQQFKDAGRTQIYMGTTQVTGIVAESVITCNITKGQAAQTAASTYTVTAGKTLRIQTIRYGISGASGLATIRLRVTSVSGAALWEDSLLYGATTVNQTSETQNFPDGMELSAGTVINWTMACASTSQKVDVALVGFEY